jgi:glycosyltransferase involved in cell wall biosynthesis
VFACVYIQRSVINKIGLLDDDFFAYFEDTDYCLRANSAGFQVVVNGDICVKHSENSSTKINKVSHSKIFLKSQNIFKSKWEATLEKERYSNGMVDFHSILNFPSGYAGSAREYLQALDRVGTRTAYQYVYGPGTVFPLPEPTHSDSYLCNLISQRKFGAAPTQIVYAQGDVFERNTGKTKIGFTMLEVNGLPEEWVRQANLMDEIWVPSSFNVNTFRQSGVTKPIHVIPLGINPAYFSPEILGWKPPDTYTFLSVFEWGERKNPELLIKAFNDEFSGSENVTLICKVNNFDSSINLESEIKRLALRTNGGRIFIAPNRIMKHYELGTLYRSADCFVLPTRGEGWGMPILEAMACGLPVIATNWSSQTDFMDSEYSLPIEVEKLIPAIAKCPYYDGFQWAEASYEHLRAQMRWVYQNQEKGRMMGLKASKIVRQKWTWEEAAKKIVKRLKALN